MAFLTSVDASSRFLIEVSAKATLLLLVAWLITCCLIRSSAAIRHRVWSLTMMGVMALPVLSTGLPTWKWTVLPAASQIDGQPIIARTIEPLDLMTNEPVENGPPDQQRAKSTPTTGQIGVSTTDLQTSDLTPMKPTFKPIAWRSLLVIGGWLIGFIVCLVGVVVGLSQTWQLSRRSQPIKDHGWRTLIVELQRRLQMRHEVELRECSSSMVPLTCGIFRPMIVLPPAAHNWTDSMRRMVVLHELAHVQRADVAFQLLGRLACAMYWFHPLAWLALRAMRQEREQACDDAVLHTGEQATHYAEQLLEIARLQTHLSGLSLAVGMSQGSHLEKRLRAMFDTARSHAPLNWQRALTATVVSGLLIYTFAVVQPVASVVRAADQNSVKSATAKADAPQETTETTGEIRGRVRIESSNQPAAGVDVYAVKKPNGSFSLPLKPMKVTANEMGEFVFEYIKSGTYLVYSFTDKLTSRQTKFKFEKVVVNAAGVQSEPVQLALKPGVTLRARVTSEETGEPITDAFVEFHWTDLTHDHFTANDHGEIVIPNLTTEKWHVEVAAKGHARAFKDVELHAPETVVDFSLAVGGDVSGTVVDQSGDPLSNVSIAVGSSKTAMYSFGKSTTDEEGRFVVANVPEDHPLKIHVSADGYQYQTLDHQLSDLDLKIILAPIPDAGNVSGQVVDRKGQPIRGAEIKNTGMSSAWVRKVTSDEDGTFRMEKLYFSSQGSPNLIVRAEGYTPRELRIADENRIRNQPLTIELQPGHQIWGQVVDPDGKPVAGCWVFYNGGRSGFGGIGGHVVADAEGRFKVTSLPLNSDFEFVAKGFSILTMNRLRLDQEEIVTVKLSPMGTIIGKVTNATTGKPIPDFTIKLQFAERFPPGGRSPSFLISTRIDPGESFVSKDGQFVLDEFDDGTTYDLVVFAPGYDKQRVASVVAMPLKTAEPLMIELQPSAEPAQK